MADSPLRLSAMPPMWRTGARDTVNQPAVARPPGRSGLRGSGCPRRASYLSRHSCLAAEGVLDPCGVGAAAANRAIKVTL
jgi:hypothetical protein